MSNKIILWFVVIIFAATSLNSSLSNNEYINKTDNSTMVMVPGGSFDFGLTDAQMTELKRKYKPSQSFINSYFIGKGRKFTCNTFYIDKYEITNAQFLNFINQTHYSVQSTAFDQSKAARNPKWPVTKIGWQDANAYAKWAGKRLPSEEEWEKAAKGTHSLLYPWGNEDEGKNYNGANQGYYSPVNVGSYPSGKSEYGAMDMAGNVYEMTTGRWDGEPCMKGGSYLNRGFYTMCSFRWAADDTINGDLWLGFRCVKDVSK